VRTHTDREAIVWFYVDVLEKKHPLYVGYSGAEAVGQMVRVIGHLFSYQGGLRRTDPTFRNLVLHSMDGKFAGHLNRYAPELQSSQLSYPENAKADEVRSLTCFVMSFCRI
jgi:hypothetical protein